MVAVSNFIAYCILVGKVGGAVVGVLAACAAVAKSPIGKGIKWFYVRVAGEPIGSWFRQQIRVTAIEVIDQKLLTRNGGTTIPDVVSRIETLTREVESNHQESIQQHAENSGRLDLIEANGRPA